MPDAAAAEMIGPIILISIIGTAVMIFSVVYLPTIQIHPVPSLNLVIACDNIDARVNLDGEYRCQNGIFSCPPPVVDTACASDCTIEFPADQEKRERCILRCSCEEGCKHRESVQRDDSLQWSGMYYQCIDSCSGYCSDHTNCQFLYICHTSGDSIEINRMRIIAGGTDIPRDTWLVRSPDKNIPAFTQVTPAMASFSTGDTLMIPLDGGLQGEDVSVIYSSPHGGEYVITQNNFAV